MRRTVGVLAAMLVAVAGAGCGAVNKGTAFADEFTPLLEERENVETSRIVASNNLPWTGTATVYVTLVDGLSDDEIVEEVWEITSLEVDNQIRYDLQVQLPAENLSGGPATAGLHLGVEGPAPDDDGLRDDIRERVGLARDLVALGDGETVASPGRWSSRLETETDAVGVALGICADDDLAQDVDQLTISGLSVDGSTSRVVLDDDADCDWLADANDLLEVADSLGPVAEYVAEYPVSADAPSLRLTYAAGTVVDPTDLQRLAAGTGIALTVL
jgi:hypothetical protein